jgi:hypothetical protein
VDDLFGGPPADQPEPAPADESVDSLFGQPPADEPAPAPEMPADDPSIDNLFGEEPAPAPSEPPADDLFSPPSEAPDGEKTAQPPSDPLDDLFGEPPADAEKPDASPDNDDSLDDLFGEPPAPEGDPPADDSLEDLFGWNDAKNDSPSAGQREMVDAEPTIDALFDLPEAASETNDDPSSDRFSDPGGRPAAAPAIDDLFGQRGQATEPSPGVAVVETTTFPSIKQPGDLTALQDLVVERPDMVQIVSTKPAADLDPLRTAQTRTWVDNTGNFRTVGKLIEIHATSIRLLKENGRTCTVPKRRLSRADAAYVDRMESEINALPLAMVTPR